MTNSFIETKAAETSQTEDRQMVLRKRIGSTNYEVFARFVPIRQGLVPQTGVAGFK